MTRKTRLARSTTLTGRGNVYVIDGGLEIIERQSIDLVRRRVFWDDVLAITFHREVPPLDVAVLGTIAAVGVLIALIVLLAGSTMGAAVVSVFTLVPATWLVVALVQGSDVVTVQGRRTSVRMSFRRPTARGRQTFDDLCARVRRKHREMEIAAAADGDAGEDGAGTDAPPTPPPEGEIPVPPT